MTARQIVSGLAFAENLGDVYDYIPDLCKLLDLPEPEWDDAELRFIMAWEDEDE